VPAQRSWIPPEAELPPAQDQAYVPSELTEAPRLRFPAGAVSAYEDNPPPQAVLLLAPYLTRTFRVELDADTLADVIDVGSLVASAAREEQLQRAAQVIETLTPDEFSYANIFMSHRQRYFVDLLPLGSEWDQLIDAGLNALGAWELFELGRLVARNNPYGLLAELGVDALMALGVRWWQDRSFGASAQQFGATIAGDAAAYEAQSLVNVLTSNPETYPSMFLAEPAGNLVVRLQSIFGLSLGMWVEQNLVKNVREVLDASSQQIWFGRSRRQALREATLTYILDVVKLVRETLEEAWNTANTPDFDATAAGMWEYTLPSDRWTNSSPVMDSTKNDEIGPGNQLYTPLGSYADARDDVSVGGFGHCFAAETGGWSPKGSLYSRMLRLPSLGALIDTCLNSVAIHRGLLAGAQESTRPGGRPLMGSVHTLRSVFHPLLAGAIPVGAGGWLNENPDQYVIPNWRNTVNVDRTDIGTILDRVFGGGEGYQSTSLNFADKLTSFVFKAVSLMACYFRDLGVDKYIGMCSRPRRRRLLRWYNRGGPFFESSGLQSRTISEEFQAANRQHVDTVTATFASQNVGGRISAPADGPAPPAPSIREPETPPDETPTAAPSPRKIGMWPIFLLGGLGAMVLLTRGGTDADRS